MEKHKFDNYPALEYIGSFESPQKMPHDLPHVCFLGRSNAGKSSLISALCANPGIVKTSKKPGHTKSLNLFRRDRIYLVDMPGFGYAQASFATREALSRMIFTYLTQSQSLRAGVLLLDCKRKPGEEEEYIRNLFKENNVPLILALTKSDRFNQKETSALRKEMKRLEKDYVHVLETSVKTGKNIDYIDNFLRSMGV